MTENSTEYVTSIPSGGWRVSGTRVSLSSIVHAYWEGKLPEAIVTNFPALTLEQVYGAIAFYLGHRDTVDQFLGEQEAHWQQFEKDSAARHGPLLQRIRGAAKQTTSSGSKP
jgi:uncharacterized protein (DUF433 family)